MNQNESRIGRAISGRAAARYWRATQARDRRADGEFVLAVRSTRIYCRPSCPARRPLRRNVLFYRTGREAEIEGFRPCLRCRPQEIAANLALVRKALSGLLDSEQEGLRLEPLAARLGIAPSTLRRAFARVTGLKPHELAGALRLGRFKALLRAGKKITEALYETGYGSPSRVYERSNSQLGMTPAAYRRGGKGMRIEYTVTDSPLGKLLVGATDRGVSAVYLGASAPTLLAQLRREYPLAEIGSSKTELRRWVREIVNRIEGHLPALDLPLDLRATAFERRVWQELQKIPLGQTRSYGQVARSLGRPKAVRAVARACARNPVSVLVPCHRVIRGDGSLAGYRWGLGRKQALLGSERSRTQSSRQGLPAAGESSGRTREGG